MAFVAPLLHSPARRTATRLVPRCNISPRPQTAPAELLRRATATAAVAAALALPLPVLSGMNDVLVFDHDQTLVGANFEGRTDLRGAIFSKANCKGASFAGADLTNAQLDDTNFIGANLEGVAAANVTATKAKFQKANLNNAVFTNANMVSALFDGASITGADFSDSLLDRVATVKLCKIASGVNPTTGVSTAESLMCPE